MMLTASQALRFVKANQSGILVVIGGFLLNVCFSLDYSYANLNTYVTSYMRQNGNNPNMEYKDFIFLTAGKRMTQGVFTIFGGMISQRLGARMAIVVGCIILIAGYSVTFFSLESNFFLVVLSVGVCHGVGFCLVYVTAVGVAQQWFPAHIRGLISSLVISGYGYGSLIWIPMETAFVNPDNVDPGEGGYYDNQDLLDRVPYSFFLMAGVLAAFAIPGILLTREPPEEKTEEQVFKKTEVTEEEEDKAVSLSPKEVLQTRVFYKIWLGQFAIALAQGLLLNWRKTFGLTLITSDHFHANVEILTCLCNGTSRIIWGLLYDKFGYRRCVLVMGVIVTAVISSLPLLENCEQNGTLVKALWITLMAAIFSTFPGSFPIMAASIRDAFGPVHYRANFGLLFTITVAYYAVLLICSQVPAIFDYLDFRGMFLLAGGVGVFGIAVNIFTPDRFNLKQDAK